MIFLEDGESAKRLSNSGPGLPDSPSLVPSFPTRRTHRCARYRVFAELLDLAVQAGLEISIPAQSVLPSPDLAASPTISSDPPLSEKPAVNPLHVLQPPAFYFYTAASCSIQRRARFLEAQAVEVSRPSKQSEMRADQRAQEDALTSEAGAASGYVSTAPGYANEKKVDHVGLIVEV